MSDFPEKAEDRVNTLAIVCIGLATTAVLWASVVALQAYFQNSEGDIATERAAMGQTAEIRDLDAEQLADLSKTTYADPKKGTLKRLNIEHAKAAVVADAKSGAPTLIPSLGALDVPSIPAVPGKPADDATVEAPAPDPAEPALPGATEPAAVETPSPTPTDPTAPAAPAPAAPAPAAPASAGTTP